MGLIITLRIEKLTDGVYLATCNELQGLVAQGRTIQETLDIARDVAINLIDSRQGTRVPFTAASDAVLL